MLHRAPSSWWSLRLLAILGLVWVGANVCYFYIGSNLHVVIEDRCYRSGQPDPGQLARWVKAHGIRTVINLRGKNTGHPWYDAEAQSVTELGIELLDVPLTGTQRTPEELLRGLVDAIENAREPVLLHCQQGIDRTGFGAAAYLLIRSNTALESARQQLHLRYGHFPVARCRHLNELFDEYQDWLDLYDGMHSPERFCQWARVVYKT